MFIFFSTGWGVCPGEGCPEDGGERARGESWAGEWLFQTFFKIELLKPKTVFPVLTLTTPLFSGEPGWAGGVDFGYCWAPNKVGLHSSHSCGHFKIVPVIVCCSIYLHFFTWFISGCRGAKRCTSLPTLILYLPISVIAIMWYWYCLFTLNKYLDFSLLLLFLQVKLTPTYLWMYFKSILSSMHVVFRTKSSVVQDFWKGKSTPQTPKPFQWSSLQQI